MNGYNRLDIAELPAPAKARPQLDCQAHAFVVSACRDTAEGDPEKRHEALAAMLRASWPEARVVNDRRDGRRLVAFQDVVLDPCAQGSANASAIGDCRQAFLDIKDQVADEIDDPHADRADAARAIAGLPPFRAECIERKEWIARAIENADGRGGREGERANPL